MTDIGGNVMVKSIKGLNKDMTCLGFKFEPGVEYSIDGKLEICQNGFHAIPDDEHPLSVFGYYAPSGSRYFEVEQSGDLEKEGDKLASAKIRVDIELSISDIVSRAVSYVFSLSKKTKKASATGNQGAASATGDRGAASATGNRGAASATGDRGRVMGVEGNALFLTERDEEYNIINVWAGIVGRDGVQPGVWYTLTGGKLTEVE